MKIVLVIDLLEDYFREGPLADARAALVRSVNALTRHARSQGFPVIWVRQEFRNDLSDAFLVMREKGIRISIAGTPGCQLLAELERDPEDHEIIKKRYSAFFGTGLDELLQELEAKS